MKSLSRHLFIILTISLLLSACKSQKTTTSGKHPSGTINTTTNPNPGANLPVKKLPKAPVALQPLTFQMPEMPREFRGVWIATVANIDWPISPDDTYEKQKRDFLNLLDYYKNLNFNAVIVKNCRGCFLSQ